MSNVNSIRPDGGTSLRPLCEVRPVAHAFRKGKSLATTGGAGQRDNERVLKETVNERKAATSPPGGWRQNGRKCKRGKQGDLSGATRRSWPGGPKNRPIGVRASIVARKRVTSVEPRDAGRWKDEEQNNGRQTDASARRGYAAVGDLPSTIDLAGTAGLAGILVRGNRGTHLIETPLTGKPDAGNPPVRFGGRGEVNPSSLPLSLQSLAQPFGGRSGGGSLLRPSWSRQQMAARYRWLYPRAIAAAGRRRKAEGIWLVINNFSTGGAQSSARRLL